MKHLLDVNVLLAAIWQHHPDFAKADAWLPGRRIVSTALSAPSKLASPDSSLGRQITR